MTSLLSLRKNEELFRFMLVLVLVTLMLGVSVLSGWADNYIGDASLYDPFTASYTINPYSSLSDLLADMKVDTTVRVTAEVGEVLEDYTSKKGYVYQQFYLQEGSERLKVFCSTYKGRVQISEGDTVSITGTLQEYYNELEIYTDCGEIDVV